MCWLVGWLVGSLFLFYFIFFYFFFVEHLLPSAPSTQTFSDELISVRPRCLTLLLYRSLVVD